MKKVQKIVLLSGLMVAAIYLIFTLSFSTNWAVGELLGDFFLEAQVANKAMFTSSIRIVVIAALMLIFGSHTNRRFFVSNYVLTLGLAAYMIFASIQTIQFMPPLKTAYLALDPFMLELITAINYGKISTQIFDIGIIISVLMIIQSLLMCFVVFNKFQQEKIRAKTKHMQVEGGAML